MTIERLGLRDRKRIETRQRLEACAVELVLRDGIENATIDAISELADVSPRTFFNYFDCKEDAILGVRDVEITDEHVAAHIAEHAEADAIESIVRLILTMIGTSVGEHEVRAQRLELVVRYPQLMSRRFTHMTRVAQHLTSAATAILATDDRFADAEPATVDIILTICGSAVRVAVMELAAAHGEPDIEQLQQRATGLVREVVQKLQ
ncbi:AcrR family transcriptional regulator [Conyzicola lurida]|uniref:AcrR family transcriptional regulator n=1 Tax=Conyzicola lurida TaxID=1172621 RepID=A0A841ANT0_9MICO|nr:TetR/AcrR family transcriptional regulator [Conyzicola lurida]MBB5843974.1 AcrR family transcriptional regulator [Conyzicola lurida]